MTNKEFRERYTEREISEKCWEIAQTITLREYSNGSSEELTRPTTKPEEQIIQKVSRAALDAFGYSSDDIDGILSMAEFIIMEFLGLNVNTYDTIYIPLRIFTETGAWRKRA